LSSTFLQLVQQVGRSGPHHHPDVSKPTRKSFNKVETENNKKLKNNKNEKNEKNELANVPGSITSMLTFVCCQKVAASNT
jgi:hypothetical protein